MARIVHGFRAYPFSKVSLIRLQFSIALQYEVTTPGTDFIFNVHAAQTRQQQVVSESLQLSQNLIAQMDVDAVTHNRYLRINALTGPLHLCYQGTVDIAHWQHAVAPIKEVPVAQLPGTVLPYLYPSRYCQSDRLHKLAVSEFGHLWQGYSRVQAICDWVHQRIKFQPNTSSSTTTAEDTLIERVGVCRDFAHLMIALCRAVNIPARFATGIDFGADLALGPPDFHAYVEVFLGGRWCIFDPSGTAIPQGFIRIATGRDAADAAFATIYGSVQSSAPLIHIAAVPNAQGVCVQPLRVAQAVSTEAA
jgi:transglutaminase-like putative cysteine protease